MKHTKTTEALIDRAAAQIVRQISKTPVADLKITGARHATPWVSVDVRFGKEGGIQYIRAALGLKGNFQTFEAPFLIEAIAKEQPEAAHGIVRGIIEKAINAA